MIIKEVELENFQCYYGRKIFKFEKGMNIILGANAHGKSKFFDGINWLLNGADHNREQLISEKAKANNLDFVVAVKFTCERNRKIYQVQRSFEVSKIGDKFQTTKSTCTGLVDDDNGDRIPADGEELLDSLFPTILRKYSLFKGERSLNIFDPKENKDALLNLVNALSDFRTLDTYVGIAKEAYLRHTKVLDRRVRSNQKQQKEYNRLIADRDYKHNKITDLEAKNRSADEELYQIRKRMEDNISFVESGPQLQKVNSKITNIEKERSELQFKYNNYSNFTVDLFDSKWLLMSFDKVQDAFEKKVNSLSRKKRELTKQFDEEQGKIKGKKELLNELTKTKTPLPIGAPTKEHMEEMLEEELCKVCNRVAVKGSEAYDYMQERLKKFIEYYTPEEADIEEEQIAFKNEFIEELRSLNNEMSKKRKNINNSIIGKDILENYDMLDLLKMRIGEKQKGIGKFEEERAKIINKSNAGEETILDAATSIREYNIDIPRLEKKISKNKEDIKDFKIDLSEIQAKIDKINIEEGLDSENIKTSILRDLQKITKEVREDVFDKFINELEIKTNEYYKKFGDASSGFTGSVRIKRSGDNSISIKTIDVDSDVDITHTLSSSTQTSINISILMAISDLSIKNSGEALPMIFDAPTSEFDLAKSIEFYRLCRENFDQSIIMTKDFLDDSGDGKFVIGEGFKKIKKDKGFWVKLEQNINPEEMSTVDSHIINL